MPSALNGASFEAVDEEGDGGCPVGVLQVINEYNVGVMV